MLCVQLFLHLENNFFSGQILICMWQNFLIYAYYSYCRQILHFLCVQFRAFFNYVNFCRIMTKNKYPIIKIFFIKEQNMWFSVHLNGLYFHGFYFMNDIQENLTENK